MIELMKDMNFFSAFIKKKKGSDTPKIIVSVIILVVAIFIVGTFSYFTIATYINNNEAQEYRDKLQTEDIKAKVKESNEVNDQIDNLTQYDNRITIVNNAIASRDIVTVTLMNQISATIPSEVNIATISIDNTKVTIGATSSNKTAIAEFQHNLKEIDSIYDVYIGSISGDEGAYVFTAECTFKGVD